MEEIDSRSVLDTLSYPFDANDILSKKKQLKRKLLGLNREYITKKIAILGGYTTHDIRMVLELFLLRNGIKPVFYESEYNRFYQDAMFPNEELEKFSPDIIYLCTCNRNIIRYPELNDSRGKVSELLRDESSRYQVMWDHVADVYHCPVIQNNFELPMYRLLGNKEASDIHGAVNFITRLNMDFYQYADTHDDFYICDINYISADFGLKEWSNPFYWYMYKYALNLSAIPYLAFNVANIIKSIFGKNKKGMVLDLDNTLWGGIIGDDGVDQIQLGPEEPEGQAYMDFQNYLKKHKKLGIVLNINSKNERENALQGLQHPDSVLEQDDFIVIQANWEPKDKNFKEIAQKLNVLPESLVFIDDNPAERELIRTDMPEVEAPPMTAAHEYIQLMDRSGFFESTAFSEDDSNRAEMYRKNKERAQYAATYTDYREYLLSLDMRAEICPFDEVHMARIAQLTNKSNQFNLTTKRYTQKQIKQFSLSEVYITMYAKLEDRFGNNGVVSVVIGRQERGVCHIELWLMSCRVLKRDLEYAMMDELVSLCKDKGISEIRGYYYPTAKNKMVKDFYESMGYTKIVEDDQGNTVWQYHIPGQYKKKNEVIRLEES